MSTYLWLLAKFGAKRRPSFISLLESMPERSRMGRGFQTGILVSLDADASDLFPLLRGLRVKGEGTAEVRFADQGGIGGGIAPSGGAVAPP